MRSAIIENGVVVNVIVGSIPGSVECADGVGPGWTYDGKTYTAPPGPTPEVIEPEPDYDAELVEAIRAATTIAGLKAALIGSIEGSRVHVSASRKG